MKSFLTVLPFLFVSFNAATQDLNRDTVSVRWVRVQIDTTNEFLVRDSSCSILEAISSALKDEQNIVFLERSEIELKVKLYPKIDFSSDSIRALSGDGLSTNLNYDESNSLSISMNTENPLCYEDASAVIIWCDGIQGLQCFTYPPETTYVFPLHNIENFKIREEKQFNAQSQQWEFFPIGISFFPIYGNHSNYHLWFDLSLLKNATAQTNKSLEFLLEKSIREINICKSMSIITDLN